MIDRKYLIPLLVGLGVILLCLVAGTLFFNGYTPQGAAAAASALAVAGAEARRQSRADAQAQLDEAARKAEESEKRLSGLEKGYDRTKGAVGEDVAGTTLADLVREENERNA